MEIFFFLVALSATTIGAMSGMGGGLMMKPILDMVSGYEVAVINFMSSSTVFVMSLVSVYQGRKDQLDMNYPTTMALAVGGCIGGVVGRLWFRAMVGDIATLQSMMLLLLNILIYVYIRGKENMRSIHVKSRVVSVGIGCGLGILSSFLGIGGGQVNVMVLYLFYSTTPKVTMKRSLFIILISQASGLLTTLMTGIPEGVHLVEVGLMMVGGCSGALLGRELSKKCTDAQIHGFFQQVLVGIMLLNAYNVLT